MNEELHRGMDGFSVLASLRISMDTSCSAAAPVASSLHPPDGLAEINTLKPFVREGENGINASPAAMLTPDLPRIVAQSGSPQLSIRRDPETLSCYIW
ncbi:hypothetical protein [Maliponia aquimaris]|uniref:hypothetical protein n=1 Tax=Maliponia aquimaris TaxID=1673631 RepID=UPI00113FE2CE|nr:hypothetical protein [Maliponia aquimaris]